MGLRERQVEVVARAMFDTRYDVPDSTAFEPVAGPYRERAKVIFQELKKDAMRELSEAIDGTE